MKKEILYENKYKYAIKLTNAKICDFNFIERIDNNYNYLPVNKMKYKYDDNNKIIFYFDLDGIIIPENETKCVKCYAETIVVLKKFDKMIFNPIYHEYQQITELQFYDETGVFYITSTNWENKIKKYKNDTILKISGEVLNWTKFDKKTGVFNIIKTTIIPENVEKISTPYFNEQQLNLIKELYNKINENYIKEKEKQEYYQAMAILDQAFIWDKEKELKSKKIEYEYDTVWFRFKQKKTKRMNQEKCGKWMYHYFYDIDFNNLEDVSKKEDEINDFLYKICTGIIERGWCVSCKYRSIRTNLEKSGVICFYTEIDNAEENKHIIQYMIDNDLIRKTKTGKYYNISFKLDSQTNVGEYGKNFKAKVKLSDYIDLETGQFIK